MCIKKLRQKFNKPCKLLVVTGITIGLLGAGYGYWTDQVVINTTIETPTISLDCDDSDETISIAEGEQEVTNQEPVELEYGVKFTQGSDSDICKHLFLNSCEIYYTEGSNSEVKIATFDFKQPTSNNLIITGLLTKSRETADKRSVLEAESYIIQLNGVKLKESLNHQVGVAEGRLKVKLIFKQDLENEQEGWEYDVEKSYKVEFILDELLAAPNIVQPLGGAFNNTGIVPLPNAEPSIPVQTAPAEQPSIPVQTAPAEQPSTPVQMAPAEQPSTPPSASTASTLQETSTIQ